MSDRVSFGVSLTKDAREMADEMVKSDVRPTFSNFLEWLIRAEYDRRQRPTNMTDNRPVVYSVGGEEA